MKTKLFVLLFFLSFSAGFVSAQKKDEISGFEKTTLTLNGNFQGINTRYDEKIISFQNTSGVTIYLALKNKNGVKDTTKTITYYNGELIYLYNPISDSIWIKGAYGTLEVYIYQGTGRGFIKSSPGSSNGNYSDSLKRFVQFSDSTTKYSTPASVNTALAGYYSKTASDARYLYKNDSLKYYSVNNLDTSLIAQQNQQNTFTENQKVPVLAVGSSGISPIPKVAVGITNADTNRHGLNVVATDVNKMRNTQSQATDSASASISMTLGGTPYMTFRDKAGAVTFNVDSLGRVTSKYDIQSGNDIYTYNGRFVGMGSNATATSGVFMKATADGVLTVYNAGISDFGRLNFGGTSSSFPALKKSGAKLLLRLADDSGYTSVAGNDFISDSSSFGLVLKDSNGNYWRFTVTTGGSLTATNIGTTMP